ncbi:MAG: deoxynucleoside kinase [Candidatus Gottesmanbacteria bacterium]|nr:deoxynucleoside kinase [Candidatus Gottesmanbacteria bacterium]
MNPERKGSIIGIIGNLGSGKSTLAELLRVPLHAEVLLESVDNNPFIHDAHKSAGRVFQNQVWFLLQTVTRWEQATHLAQNGKIAIMDTFTPTNLLHSKVTLDADSFVLYKRLADRLTKHLPPPTLVIYLHDTLDFLMDRLRKRNLPIDDENAAYVEKMLVLHEDWVNTAKFPAPILSIQSRKLENSASVEVYIRQIQQLLS